MSKNVQRNFKTSGLLSYLNFGFRKFKKIFLTLKVIHDKQMLNITLKFCSVIIKNSYLSLQL